MGILKFMMARIGSPTSCNRRCGRRTPIKWRRQVIRLIGTGFSLALFLIALALAAPAPQQLRDPIFRLIYDPAIVKFGPVPDRIAASCPELTNAKWDRKMWVFAQVNPVGSQYAVIGGYFVKRAAQGRATPEIEIDKSGAVVRVSNGRCDLIGAARDVFDYPPEGLQASLLKDLAKDAVCRYSRAFGGHEKFVATLRRQGVVLTVPPSSILKDAIADAGVCDQASLKRPWQDPRDYLLTAYH
ncbi:MAG: hypothetical protein WBE37_21980 [Bryobacteraceae bacterium]